MKAVSSSSLRCATFAKYSGSCSVGRGVSDKFSIGFMLKSMADWRERRKVCSMFDLLCLRVLGEKWTKGHNSVTFTLCTYCWTHVADAEGLS